MTISTDHSVCLKKLQTALQHLKTGEFEELVACLISELLQVGVSVAKAGFQFGADAGTAGRQSRNLRLECKRYKDDTPLNERELLGEIDQALARDKLLELWVLASSREVPEQLENALYAKSIKDGIPILIIDWKKDCFNSLAALCCISPDLVGVKVSPEAKKMTEYLRHSSRESITKLKKDLESWSIGYDSLLESTRQHLDDIWTNEKQSTALFAQNVAGGKAKAIVRQQLIASIDAWWEQRSDSPVGLLGLEGVGKTWAATSWLVERKNELPIIILIPSTISLPLKQASETDIKRFLALRLAHLAKSRRDEEYWIQRVNRLLDRPVYDGPVFLLFFDGLNQESTNNWVSLFQKLQGDDFSGKVRAIFSTRKLHFQERLKSFKGLLSAPTLIEVCNYEDSPGGEFDQKLAQVNMKRGDIPVDLIEIARNPRLFDLVVQLRDRLNDSTTITVHRLLWEYGKDTIGGRVNRSFSEEEWQSWLKRLANELIGGRDEFSLNEIGETAKSPFLSATEVYARLSEIVDGNLTVKLPESNNHQFRPEIVAHALGIALLSDLSKYKSQNFEEVEAKLNNWLDPIKGLDQRSEALRAAVSILIEKNNPSNDKLAGVLVTAWLQSQNLPDAHVRELTKLSSYLCKPLLDAIEFSKEYAQSSPRSWAVHALRAIPRNDLVSYDSIIERCVDWLRITSLDKRLASLNSPDAEKHRQERINNLIGVDTEGERNVLGVTLTLVDDNYETFVNLIPALIEYFPLKNALPIFEVAAVSHSIHYRGKLRNDLNWLVLMNEVDPEDTLNALRALSEDVKRRVPEQGINFGLRDRIAAMILFFSPEESDEIVASDLNGLFDNQWNYERDYLANPSKSLYGPERRHAGELLRNKDINLLHRVRSVREYLLDPTFEVPQEFVKEVEDFGNAFEVSLLDTSRSRNAHDLNLETLEIALARCSPSTLAKLTTLRLDQLNTSHPEARYMRSLRVAEHFLLAGPKQKDSIKELRLNRSTGGDKDEWHIASLLFQIELYGKPAFEQAELILKSNVDTILVSLDSVLNRLEIGEAEQLVASYGSQNKDQIYILLFLLKKTNVSNSDYLWKWLIRTAENKDPIAQQEVFEVLYNSDPMKFGYYLDSINWHWSPDHKDLTNVFGTLALVKATIDCSFEIISARLAPWLLLESVRIRGCNRDELDLATVLIDEVVKNPNENIPDLGSDLDVNLSMRNKYLENLHFRLRESESAEEALAFDHDKKQKQYKSAINLAVERITQARKDGFQFYVHNFQFVDLELLVKFQYEYVHKWLAGMDDLSVSFRRQVLVNGGFYYVLCEALLEHKPEIGTRLWEQLWSLCVSINYYNEGGVNSLTHMLFRVSYHVEIENLKLKLLEPSHSNTDEKLFNIAIAATYNNHAKWLHAVIENDRNSLTAWKRRRSILLSGFLIQNDLYLQNAWPEKFLTTSYEKLRYKSSQRQLFEAISAHYWNQYLNAENSVNAYASWILFINSADRRAWRLFKSLEVDVSGKNLKEEKIANWKMNLNTFKNTIKKQEDKFDRTYLGFDVPDVLGHWMH